MSPALHTLTRQLRWIAPLAVLTVAAVLRFWALDRPDTLVFDEIYYVRDAVSQLAHGFTTTWPDDEPIFGGERARSFSDQPNAIAHPPLGKWLIALGIMVFGPDSGWGWRASAAFFGVATVAITMRLGWLISRSLVIACLAGLFLAIDGVHVTLSRVGLLDIFLTFGITLGALCVWHDQSRVTHAVLRGRIVWWRPWLLAAGVCWGAAAAVKWSGLYALAAMLVLIALRDWWLRRRARHTSRQSQGPVTRQPVLRALLQALTTALITLPVAAATYLASWAGWLLHPSAQNRSADEPWWVSFATWHADALSWHSTLSAPHPYQSHPLSWPLALRPTAMYEVHWGAAEGCRWVDGCVAAISPIPNALVTWGGVLAVMLLASVVLRSAISRVALASPAVWAAAFVLTGYLSGWLPWVLTFSRSAVFQFYAVVLSPFAALALALALGALAHLRSPTRSMLTLAGMRLDAGSSAVHGRRIAVTIFVVIALVLSVLFFPVWSGTPTAEWFWRAHLWLPGWD